MRDARGAALPSGSPAPAAGRAAARLRVEGVVQGVGFRPFVHRMAVRHDLDGWVRNGADGVEIVVEGTPGDLRVFRRSLATEAPPVARVERVRSEAAEAAGLEEFRVLESTDDPDRRQPVSPDVAVCDACLDEMRDPSDRRYRYPFITCTDCGPRYTVIEAMPYDRERTSMRAFEQCPACLEEYRSPASRKYHSETNSCPECGPRLWLAGPDGDEWTRRQDDEGRGVYEESLVAAAELLADGAVVAVKGVGGVHLAAAAASESAVARLREGKGRDEKPLAVMARDLEEARLLARVGGREEELLRRVERPIVLLRRRPDAAVAPSVSPGLDTVGVMLPYTPLHHLLLEAADRPLLMTSGNRSGEPLAAGNGEALRRLEGIADAFLLHDRKIVARCDDSVVRFAGLRPVMIRRARGWAPLPVTLPLASPRPLLAVGPHLKNTLALVHGDSVYPSPHLGDLDDLETLEHFEATLDRLEELYRIRPEAVARDLHPDYVSSRFAEESGITPVIRVQHHHAHLAAVAAEHGVAEPVVALVFDGTGYGTDGRIWGAEALVGDLMEFRRAGRMRYAPLPGGDLAVSTPWRSALGYLSLEPGEEEAFGAALAAAGTEELRVASRQVEAGFNTPLASSMGRLFDAAAAVLDVRGESAYEAQAAMELEARAGELRAEPLPFPLRRTEGLWVMDPLPLLSALGRCLRDGESTRRLAAAFHVSVADTAAELAGRICREADLNRVVLAGGVFQNARLLRGVARRLREDGFEPLLPRELGPGDGAISVGQATVAAARLDGEAA